MTKCDFHKYGPSGTIEKADMFCLLPQNIFSEKIFIMMWVWFIGLAILSAVNLVYLVMVVSLKSMRTSLITVSYHLRKMKPTIGIRKTFNLKY
jgi:hypothetical protein